MSKELIFMGREAGKVRLALFDDSHGTARKLPVKEITEEVFVAGVKAGNLPVRGFGVSGGRITCKYGDWYKLPDVGAEGALSLFGLAHFGEVETNEYDRIEGIENINYYNANQVKYYGIASIDWDGTFRVLSPGTYFHLSASKRFTLYTYEGPITKKKLKINKKKAFGTDAQYCFEECDSTESMDEIATWMRANNTSVYIYIQWLYQRCENFACNSYEEEDVLSYLTGQYSVSNFDVVQLGVRPIDVLEVPEQLLVLAVNGDRKIGTVRLRTPYSMTLSGFDNILVECESVRYLTFKTDTHARLVRSSEAPEMGVYGWEGFSGSDGDYTGYNISSISNCFRAQPDTDYLLFDVGSVQCSFTDIVGVTVEFTKPLRSINHSFHKFVGKLLVDSVPYIEYSFESSVLSNPLDLSKTLILSNSVCTHTGEIILPEYFHSLQGDVFVNTPIRHVVLKPDLQLSSIRNSTVSITNPDLTVEVPMTESDTQKEFYYGELADLIYTAPHGSIGPKFNQTSVFPTSPLRGVTHLTKDTFIRLQLNTLDFNLYPDVELIPEGVAEKCAFNTVIFSPKVKKIETRAFVACDAIRWVYIPDTVEELGVFIQRPRIPYTICTQKGSAADTFARNNKIDVRYVDKLSQFKRVTQEVPEEMEGAVAVAILSGAEDGESTAVLSACESLPISEDIEATCIIQEKTYRPVEDAKWITNWYEASHEYDTSKFRPRLYLTMAHISNSAEYNDMVLKATEKDIRTYAKYRFNSKNYTMYGCTMYTAAKSHNILWVVLRDNHIINAFTENISDVQSSISIVSMLEQALSDDNTLNTSTRISDVIEHLNFTSKGVGVRGKILSEKVNDTIYKVFNKTYAPLGVYINKQGTRAFMCKDISSLQLVALQISSGANLDDGRTRKSAVAMWYIVRKSIGAAQLLENLDDWTRMYSILGGGDNMLQSLVDIESVPKCEDYDYTIPTAEVEAIRVIAKALSINSAFVTTSELKTALRNSNIAKSMSASGWTKAQKQMSGYRDTQTYSCSDATFKTIKENYQHVTWFLFGEHGSDGVFVAAISEDIELKLKSIVNLYDTLTQAIGPNKREDHYAHVNCMLPVDEFLIVRMFQSGGTYTSYNMFYAALGISRISGKLAVGNCISGSFIPVFWTDSFSKAFRIFDLCGLQAFSHIREWRTKNSDSITGGLFDSEIEYELGVPSFSRFSWKLKNTRENLRRGECAGYACATGSQEIFDLSTKNPRTSDFKDKQEG